MYVHERQRAELTAVEGVRRTTTLGPAPLYRVTDRLVALGYTDLRARVTEATTLRPADRGERIASAKLSGLAAAQQNGRLDEAAALAGMRAVLTEHRITTDRIVVVSDAACHYIDDPHRPRALAVLVTLGADGELTRRMRDETSPGLRFTDP